MGGLRYEVHRMPQGMRERVVSQVLEKVSAGASGEDQNGSVAERENPCMYCLRWEECNGVDKQNCPLWDNIQN